MRDHPLTGVLGDLADEFGIAAALKLAEWRGGTRFFVSGTLADNHEITVHFGLDVAKWMTYRWGGDQIKVPRALRYLRSLRDLELCARYRTETAAKLALEYELDERHVWRIVASVTKQAPAAEARQIGLL